MLLFAFSLNSCNKQSNLTPAQVDLGLSYYPTTTGKYVIYEVDSTIYTDLSKDTLLFKYRIKEKLTDTFTDNLGKPALRLERYIKKYNPSLSYDNMPWQVKEVWTVHADDKKIQVVESNLPFTKLLFPVELNASWNGNAGNALGEQNYVYSYIDKPEQFGTLNLKNVLQVTQQNYRTLINYDYSVEKYAKEIGLVYREITHLESNTIVSNIPVEQRIEQGYIFKQTLLSYGYE